MRRRRNNDKEPASIKNNNATNSQWFRTAKNYTVFYGIFCSHPTQPVPLPGPALSPHHRLRANLDALWWPQPPVRPHWSTAHFVSGRSYCLHHHHDFEKHRYALATYTQTLRHPPLDHGWFRPDFALTAADKEATASDTADPECMCLRRKSCRAPQLLDVVAAIRLPSDCCLQRHVYNSTASTSRA